MSKARLPETIGRYQIRDLVGRGGMGVLYCAFDPVLDREVAVKVMLADFSTDPEQMRTRFYREAKAAARLQHRNIVTVFEFAEEANQPHIVMEFLRGVSLGARMAATPALSLEAKIDVVLQLCAGLRYAHSQGVIHRDVTPSNVFLLEDGGVKLLDFGIAKLMSSTLTQQGDVLGSAPYMSPEQLVGSDSVDARTDVWSTGVVLFELLSGRKPFEGDPITLVINNVLKKPPLDLEALAPDLPKSLVAAVMRALEKDPARRTPSAEELGRELQVIQKALEESRAAATLDETRRGDASTHVVAAVHAGRGAEATDVVGRRPMAPTEEGLTVLAGTAPSRSKPETKTWMIAAGIVAVLVLGAVSAWMMRSPSTPASTVNVAAAPPAPAPVSTSRPVESLTAAKPPAQPVPPPSSRRKPGTESLPASAVAPKASAPPPVPAPAPAAVMVDVTMSAPYPFEVFDGSGSISAPATSHELARQPNGKTLRVQAEKVFLDRQVRITGEDGKFEYSPPALGKLDIRSARGDCRIMVGRRDLGFGPLQPFDVVAGDYQVSLSCPDGQNPQNTATVLPGRTARAYFTR